MPKKEKRNRCKVNGKWFKKAAPKKANCCFGCYVYVHDDIANCELWPSCLREYREDATDCIWVLDRKYGKKGKPNETRTSG